MKKILCQYEAQDIYKKQDGVCYNTNGDMLVMTCMPDDSGVWCEDPDTGKESFYTLREVYA